MALVTIGHAVTLAGDRPIARTSPSERIVKVNGHWYERQATHDPALRLTPVLREGDGL